MSPSEREPSSPDAALPPAVGSKEGLSSTDPRVQSASALVFTTAKDPSVEAQLLTLARSQVPDVAATACDALAHQGTETATASLRGLTVQGPTDFTRLVALHSMLRRKVSGDAGQMWRPLAARSWRVRKAALQVVARQPKGDRDREVTLVTLLMDREPAVRLTAARLLDPADELSRQRLLYFAFNDASEAVRQACVERLWSGQDSGARAEVRKLARDDSAFFASWVLSLLATGTDPADLDAVRSAALDPRPELQACAILAMAQRAGDWTKEDLGPALASEEVHVQEALLRLASVRRDLVPDATLRTVASSKNAWLSAEANRVLGGG